jgi:hypothetical protein
MSFWIVAYCRDSVASVTPDELHAGIAERLKLLTYLFCPEDEEEPDEVMARLQIEDISQGSEFRVFLMNYRGSGQAPIRIDRDDDPKLVQGEIQEIIEEFFPAVDSPPKQRVIDLLANARESIAFCLKAHDVEAMGFPLSIAAAAYLVQRAGGVIRSGSYSWMVPSGREVEIIWEFNR